MAEPLSTPSISGTVSADAIDRDLVCVECGYNLRGLRPDGICPECAAAVERSLDPQTLMNADPRWVRRLRWGIWMLMGASVAGAATALVCQSTPAWMRVVGLSSPVAYKLPVQAVLAFQMAGWWDSPGAWMDFALATLSAVLVAASVWTLTPPWPWPAHEPKLKRRALRMICPCAAFLVLLSAITPALYSRWGLWTTWVAIRETGTASLLVLDLVQGIILLAYLGDLSARRPDDRLPVWFRRLGWFLGIIGATMLVPEGYALLERFVAIDLEAVQPLRMMTELTVIVLLPVHSILLLWALFRFQARLRRP